MSTSQLKTRRRSLKRKLPWSIQASIMSKSVVNPIRRIVDNIRTPPNPKKTVIPLSLGDPTVFGNLPPDPAITSAITTAALSNKYNGYCSSTGTEDAKKAIAEYYSTASETIDYKNVVFANGCSGALEIAILTLAEKGQNVLAPAPGFSIYKTLACSSGIEIRSYRLVADRCWEADIDHMESLIDESTAAIIVNNPSNPCGSVYSKRHLLDILDVAERHRLPVISDEVYSHLVYGGEFYSLGALSKEVPVLVCGGLAKNYLVPGWRLGWIIEFDRHDAFKAEVHQGLQLMTQRIIHPNTIVMGALPDILKNTPESFFKNTSQIIKENAVEVFNRLSTVPALRPIMPSGAMYMLIGINLGRLKDVSDDVVFTEKLIAEQSVKCLPASCFAQPDFVRITLTNPKEKMVEACERIAEFCEVHAVSSATSSPTDLRR